MASKTRFNVPRTINQQRTPTKKSDKAVLAIASWADACGIPWQKSKAADLAIIDLGHAVRDLAIVVEPGQVIPTGILSVPGAEITNSNVEIALGAFHQITKPLGYGKPIPVDRGVQPGQKLCYKDDMELVAMRHGMLRSSPDLSPEQIDPYRTVIEHQTDVYFYKFKRFFDLFGYERRDISQYAHLYFLIFHHHYRKLFGTVDENKKLFTRFIQQSFINFGQAIQSKANGCFVEADSVEVALYEESVGQARPKAKIHIDALGPVIPFTTNHDYDRPPDASDDLKYQARRTLLDKTNERTRRESAAELLSKHLTALPHDAMIAALTNTDSFEYDARMAARRWLRKHSETCSVCKENENGAGSDSTGT